MSGWHNDDRNPEPTTNGSEGRRGRLKEEKRNIHESLQTMTEEKSVPGRPGSETGMEPRRLLLCFQVTLLRLNNTKVLIPAAM